MELVSGISKEYCVYDPLCLWWCHLLGSNEVEYIMYSLCELVARCFPGQICFDVEAQYFDRLFWWGGLNVTVGVVSPIPDFYGWWGGLGKVVCVYRFVGLEVGEHTDIV